MVKHNSSLPAAYLELDFECQQRQHGQSVSVKQPLANVAEELQRACLEEHFDASLQGSSVPLDSPVQVGLVFEGAYGFAYDVAVGMTVIVALALGLALVNPPAAVLLRASFLQTQCRKHNTRRRTLLRCCESAQAPERVWLRR